MKDAIQDAATRLRAQRLTVEQEAEARLSIRRCAVRGGADVRCGLVVKVEDVFEGESGFLVCSRHGVVHWDDTALGDARNWLGNLW